MDPEKSEDNSPESIAAMIDELKMDLCQACLNGKDSFNLFRASPRLFSPAKRVILKHEDHPLRKLLSHGALGELEAAQAIWQKDPFLLRCYGTVYHPNCTYAEDKAPVAIPVSQNPGRYKYVDCTFWQILLMNEEFEEAAEVGKHMSDDEMIKQFLEIFPDKKIKKYQWNLAKAVKLLRKVLAAIIEDKVIRAANLDLMNEQTRQALHALYDYVKPKPEHQIGLVFDAKIYVEALKLYGENMYMFAKWHHYSFWSIRVEEWLAACFGTGYLRPHAQGIQKNFPRSGCVLADHSSYFAFRRPAKSLPGAHFFVDLDGSLNRALRSFPGPLPGLTLRAVYKDYIKQKQAQGKALRSELKMKTPHLFKR